MPGKVKAEVDYTDAPINGLVGTVRECEDFNNTAEVAVAATAAMPELRVAIRAWATVVPPARWT